MIRTLKRGFISRNFHKKYYTVLGVSPTASHSEIKAAYFKLAKQLHPDQPTGNEAKFKEIAEAYEVLGNEEARAKYDVGMYQSPEQQYRDQNANRDPWASARRQAQQDQYEKAEWSRTYYYTYNPFTGQKEYYHSDGRRETAGRSRSRQERTNDYQRDIFRNFEEFMRKAAENAREERRPRRGLNPFTKMMLKTTVSIFMILWFFSIIERARIRRRFERETLYYDEPFVRRP